MDPALVEFSLSHLIAYSESSANQPRDGASDSLLLGSDNAPIHRFPVEILVQIFLMCIYAEYPESPTVPGGEPITLEYSSPKLRRMAYPLLRGKNLPLRLCHICWARRRIVLNTPGLWSFFTLCCKNSIMEQTMLEAEIWLSLSQSHLLAINMELITDHPTTSQLKFFSLFLNSLSRNFYKLRRIEICLYADSTWEPALFQTLRTAGDVLQTMTVSVHEGRYIRKLPPHALTFYPNSPLQYLYLNGVVPGLESLPCERLKYLAFGSNSSLSPPDLLHLLQTYPCLTQVHCSLKKARDTGAPTNTRPERILLPFLEILHLTSERVVKNEKSFYLVFDYLLLPALKVLSVESDTDDPFPSLARSLSNLESVSHSTVSQLRELNLESWQENCSSALIEVLSHTPHLRKISGRFAPLTDDIVHALTINGDHGTAARNLCPDLEEFSWVRVRSSVGSITQMLRSRWSMAPYKLRKVTLYACGWYGEEEELKQDPVISTARSNGVSLEYRNVWDTFREIHPGGVYPRWG